MHGDRGEAEEADLKLTFWYPSVADNQGLYTNDLSLLISLQRFLCAARFGTSNGTFDNPVGTPNGTCFDIHRSGEHTLVGVAYNQNLFVLDTINLVTRFVVTHRHLSDLSNIL